MKAVREIEGLVWLVCLASAQSGTQIATCWISEAAYKAQALVLCKTLRLAPNPQFGAFEQSFHFGRSKWDALLVAKMLYVWIATAAAIAGAVWAIYSQQYAQFFARPEASVIASERQVNTREGDPLELGFTVGSTSLSGRVLVIPTALVLDGSRGSRHHAVTRPIVLDIGDEKQFGVRVPQLPLGSYSATLVGAIRAGVLRRDAAFTTPTSSLRVWRHLNVSPLAAKFGSGVCRISGAVAVAGRRDVTLTGQATLRNSKGELASASFLDSFGAEPASATKAADLRTVQWHSRPVPPFHDIGFLIKASVSDDDACHDLGKILELSVEENR